MPRRRFKAAHGELSTQAWWRVRERFGDVPSRDDCKVTVVCLATSVFGCRWSYPTSARVGGRALVEYDHWHRAAEVTARARLRRPFKAVIDDDVTTCSKSSRTWLLTAAPTGLKKDGDPVEPFGHLESGGTAKPPLRAGASPFSRPKISRRSWESRPRLWRVPGLPGGAFRAGSAAWPTKPRPPALPRRPASSSSGGRRSGACRFRGCG